MLNVKKIGASVLLGSLLAIPFSTSQAGIFDWLFGKKKSQPVSLQVSELDSSSGWKCKIGGGCAGGDGICCTSGAEKRLKTMKNIEKVEVNKDTGMVTLHIKEGTKVNVEEIQKALGGHWTLKAVEKSEPKG